jgi:hypothetical protein
VTRSGHRPSHSGARCVALLFAAIYLGGRASQVFGESGLRRPLLRAGLAVSYVFVYTMPESKRSGGSLQPEAATSKNLPAYSVYLSAL